MTNSDIQNSRHLLKRLDEEMMFLSDLMAQVNSLSTQVHFISSNLKGTFDALEAMNKNWDKEEKEKE